MKIKNRYGGGWYLPVFVLLGAIMAACSGSCLLYTSDAADE